MEKRTEPHSLGVIPEQIPPELKQSAQWLVWKWEWQPSKAGQGGAWKKPPYIPGTDRKASPTNPEHWRSFEAAITAYQQGGYAGIGHVMKAEDDIQPIDLDDCVDLQTQEINLAAWAIVSRLDSYTEYSPSGTGLRIFVRGKAPVGMDGRRSKHDGWIEVYAGRHYFTVTGQHVDGTPTTIEERQAAVEAWYLDTFAPQGRTERAQTTSKPVEVGDDALLEMLRQSKDGACFERLWNGDTEGYLSASEADMRLMGLFAFATGDDEDRMRTLFEASGLYRPEKGEDYLDRTIAQAVANNCDTYSGRKRDDRRTVHQYDWQRCAETPEERAAQLGDVSAWAKEQVQTHFEQRREGLLVVTTAPGTGKSHAVAELGTAFDIAWIAERHAQVESVTALRETYRHIRPCDKTTCPNHYHLHHLLVGKGKAWPIHKGHSCEYGDQYRREGSAVFQLDHVQTAYPRRHEAIVIDEMSLSSWIREQAVTPDMIQKALACSGRLTANWALHFEAERFLKSLWEMITTAQREQSRLHGKALFNTLQQQFGPRLADRLQALAQDWMATDILPVHDIQLKDPDIAAKLENLPPVVLPLALRALVAELDKWQTDREWNSCVRITNGLRGWALYILEPRQFPMEDDHPLPPVALLDATADTALLERLTGMAVEVVHKPIQPPHGMRHIAVRTGKHYSKASLVDKHYAKSERTKAIAEMRYLLRELDPDGTLRAEGRVGLITFQGCEQALAEAVGIRCVDPKEPNAAESRTGHFGAIRGSNRLEGCDVLFVVGTFIPNLEQMVWYARMLYRDDLTPIDTTTEEIDGRKVYIDPRLREVVRYLSHAELTQCAHRNRPLRYDGRVVVTMCVGEIADLPATETIHEFPQLTEDGRRKDEARDMWIDTTLGELATELLAANVTPSVRTMRAKLKERKLRLNQKALTTWLVRFREAWAAGLAA